LERRPSVVFLALVFVSRAYSQFSPEPDHQRKGRDDHVTVYDKALKALEQGPAVAGGVTAGYYVID